MAVHHAEPEEIVNLQPLGSALQDAKTTAIVKSKTFEAVRLIVHEGMNIADHKVEGTIMLHCLEGRVKLGLTNSALELGAHQWIYLKGGTIHSIKGIEESSLLLTILF